MTARSRATEVTVRLARLLFGARELRRRSDLLEGLILVMLSALFVAAIAAAPYFGERLYQSQRAGAGQLHPATAVLTRSGPSDSYATPQGTAAARWRAPDGRQRAGSLTLATAPGISAAPAGTRVQVWLTSSGRPEAPPIEPAEAMFSSVVLAIGALSGAAIMLLICYWACRLAIDRRRLAAWASEWSLTGPRWSTRR
jgi:hypothetical protein